MAVVRPMANGHGALPVAQAALAGANSLGVATPPGGSGTAPGGGSRPPLAGDGQPQRTRRNLRSCLHLAADATISSQRQSPALPEPGQWQWPRMALQSPARYGPLNPVWHWTGQNGASLLAVASTGSNAVQVAGVYSPSGRCRHPDDGDASLTALQKLRFGAALQAMASQGPCPQAAATMATRREPCGTHPSTNDWVAGGAGLVWPLPASPYSVL